MVLSLNAQRRIQGQKGELGRRKGVGKDGVLKRGFVRRRMSAIMTSGCSRIEADLERDCSNSLAADRLAGVEMGRSSGIVNDLPEVHRTWSVLMTQLFLDLPLRFLRIPEGPERCLFLQVAVIPHPGGCRSSHSGREGRGGGCPVQPHVVRDPDKGQAERVMGTGRCVETASPEPQAAPAVLPWEGPAGGKGREGRKRSLHG